MYKLVLRTEGRVIYDITAVYCGLDSGTNDLAGSEELAANDFTALRSPSKSDT